MSAKKILLFIFSFALLLTAVFSQDTTYQKKSFFIEPILNAGKIIKNYPSFPSNDFCLVNELNLGWQTQGNKAWHHSYGFPQLGVALIYAYQGNDRVLGRTFSLMPNFSIHTLRKKNHTLELSIGCGFAYFPLIYDSLQNRENILIGSKVTAAASFSLNYLTGLSEKMQYKFGLSTFHFSNGHAQLPNVGLNSILFTTGLKYFIKPLTPLPPCKKTEREKTPILVSVRAGIGMHEFGNELGPVGGPKYKIFTASVYGSKRMGKVSNVHAGIMSKYYSNYYEYISDNLVFSNQRLKSNTFIFMLGHEFLCGRISLLTEGGINLYNPFYKYYNRKVKNDFFKFSRTWFCSRLGFQYYFLKPSATRRVNMYTGIYINANFDKADFNELCVGILF